jgi:RNA polymerase sigma factor (TIGR02999 family)
MPDNDVTRLLEAVNAGRPDAYQQLLAIVHDELRRMAAARLRSERPGHTLQPTALVNEAYLRLAEGGDWQNRAHFFGAAAKAMRRILVDHARKRASQKRGADGERVALSEVDIVTDAPDVDVLALDEAISALEEENPRLARVVQLRFFAGLTVHQIAELNDVAPVTVKRDWTYARAWLFERMSDA